MSERPTGNETGASRVWLGWADWAILAIIAALFVAGGALYHRMPVVMDTHWNAAGRADGTMGRDAGLFGFPALMLFLFVLYLPLARARSVASFRRHVDRCGVVFFLFLAYLQGLALAWNLGWRFNFLSAVCPGLAVLFYALGALCEHAEPNRFIGVRLPWTFRSPAVWRKANRLGGWLIKGWAIIILFGLVWPAWTIWFVLLPALPVTVALVIYSWMAWRCEASGADGAAQ